MSIDYGRFLGSLVYIRYRTLNRLRWFHHRASFLLLPGGLRAVKSFQHTLSDELGVCRG